MVSANLLLVLAALWFWGSFGALWLLVYVPDEEPLEIDAARFVLGGPFAWLIFSAAALWWANHLTRTTLTRLHRSLVTWSLRPVERAIQDFEARVPR
jgi:hypothetical protein